MKILFVTPAPGEASGYGRYAADVIDGAKGGGHDVSLLVAKANLTDLLKAIWRVQRVDIVYAIDGWPFGVFAYLGSLLWQKKLIIGAIGTYTIAPLKNRWYSALVRRAYTSADVVIGISNYTLNRLREIVPAVRCTLITPGVRWRSWVTNRAHIHPHRIITVGSVKVRKGHHTMLEAFAIARRSIPGLTWVIVGGLDNRRYVERLKMRAEELGVSGAIEWVGEVPDGQLLQLYSDSGLFVMLSEKDDARFEGFGIVFLEAAAAGLPVVGTLENGIADAIGPDNGVLVSQKDFEAAARAILSILGNITRWESMSRASKQWATEHNLEKMHQAHEAAYAVCESSSE